MATQTFNGKVRKVLHGEAGYTVSYAKDGEPRTSYSFAIPLEGAKAAFLEASIGRDIEVDVSNYSTVRKVTVGNEVLYRLPGA